MMLAVILALALTAAACGSDDDADDSAQTDTDETASSDDGDSTDDDGGEDDGASTDDGDDTADDDADAGAGDGIRTDGFEDLGDVTLNVLAEAGDEATLERATEIFTEQYPNVTVEVTLRAFDDYMQIAPGILQSDDPPDVAHGNQGYTIDGLLVQGGLIIPLDDYAAEYGWEDAFGSGTLDQYRFDESGTDFGQGRLWGISASASSNASAPTRRSITRISISTSAMTTSLSAAIARRPFATTPISPRMRPSRPGISCRHCWTPDCTQ